MSETDSFIEEVSEEVRRDKLFALMRRYGWIGILVVLLLVGGAAYNEWRKASEMATAQQFGDSLLQALDLDDNAARAEALAKVSASDSDSQALVTLLLAAQKQEAGDVAGAVLGLRAVADDTSLSKAYRDLALLKLVLLSGREMDQNARREALNGLATAGGAYRLLAEEQLAMLDIDAGNVEAAIARLKDILNDVDVTTGLRGRASQLIMVLGGDVDAS